MLMLDICSGLGGASQAMLDRGWEVIRVDINSEFNPDIVADVRTWHYKNDWPRPDLVWCSPPCTEFSRNLQPWHEKVIPDMSIYQACLRIIFEANPRYYVIENVRGAVKYFGRHVVSYGPFFLWGHFPDLGEIELPKVYKGSVKHTKKRAAERALVPYEMSWRLALAVERSSTFFDFFCDFASLPVKSGRSTSAAGALARTLDR